jgi:hypothetical protein
MMAKYEGFKLPELSTRGTNDRSRYLNTSPANLTKRSKLSSRLVSVGAVDGLAGRSLVAVDARYPISRTSLLAAVA